MYSIQAIILNKRYIREKQFHITLFSREYGKISVWCYKKHFSWDIWDIISCSVERKNNINKLKNFSIRHHLIKKHWEYTTLIQFLYTIKSISEVFAEYDNASYIYDDYTITLKNTGESISYDQSLLLQMRILKYSGLLNPSFFENDPVLDYIYKNITKTPLSKILSAKSLKETQKEIIQKGNLYTLAQFSEL